MIREEQKKSGKNLLFGGINKILIIVLGMLVPKIIILYLGSEVNGMLSTINQIYGYVTILEAGIGFATTQALYQPVAMGNRKRINGILSATGSYYKRIGFIYLVFILILTFAFPFVGNSSLPLKKTRVIVFLSGVPGVITFFCQGKFLLFLEAEGKSYISYNVTTVSTALTYFVKIALIVNGFDIVTVQFVVALIQISVMLYYMHLKRKRYFWLNYNQIPDYNAIDKKKDVFFHRICWFVFSNTDIILISIFLDYDMASVYAIYSLIASTVYSVIGLVWTSTVFYWGQKYNSNKGKFGKENIIFQKIYYAVVFCGNSILYLMTLPFIRLYMRGVSDTEYIDYKLLCLFVLVYTLQGLRIPSISLTEMAGHFRETKIQAIIESILNLSLSLILVQYFGVYGILIGTVVSVAYRDIALVRYVSDKIIPKVQQSVFLNWIWNGSLSFIVLFIGRSCIVNSQGWADFFVGGIKVFLIAFFAFLLGNIGLLKDIIKRRKGN